MVRFREREISARPVASRDGATGRSACNRHCRAGGERVNARPADPCARASQCLAALTMLALPGRIGRCRARSPVAVRGRIGDRARLGRRTARAPMQAGDSPLSLSLQLRGGDGPAYHPARALVLMMTSFLRISGGAGDSCGRHWACKDRRRGRCSPELALFLSLFVMAPTLELVNAQAIAPYAAGTIGADAAIGQGGRGVPRLHAAPDARGEPDDVQRYRGRKAHLPAGRTCRSRSCCPPSSPASSKPPSRSAS